MSEYQNIFTAVQVRSPLYEGVAVAAGPYADITNAISPDTITPTNGQQFFRVRMAQ